MTHSITQSQYISRNCLVCGTDNPAGLHTRFFETSGNEVIAVFTPRDVHQSYPQITHGGITAAILDETIGRAIMIGGDPYNFGVTVELNVKYKKPVPLNVELKVIGRITEIKGRMFYGTGELILPSGEIAATAEGKYLRRKLEQFTDAEFVDSEWFPPTEQPPEQLDLQAEE